MKKLIIIVLVVVSALVSGCGSNGGEVQSTPPAVTSPAPSASSTITTKVVRSISVNGDYNTIIVCDDGNNYKLNTDNGVQVGEEINIKGFVLNGEWSSEVVIINNNSFTVFSVGVVIPDSEVPAQVSQPQYNKDYLAYYQQQQQAYQQMYQQAQGGKN